MMQETETNGNNVIMIKLFNYLLISLPLGSSPEEFKDKTGNIGGGKIAFFHCYLFSPYNGCCPWLINCQAFEVNFIYDFTLKSDVCAFAADYGVGGNGSRAILASSMQERISAWWGGEGYETNGILIEILKSHHLYYAWTVR
ncbi:hypothetical protein AVEN_223934-1 [Araneus ventricosus]|uniref:Uncharacterized protein n=1 Tax=Araneus ventricosus TaxID=182803 RepID=A0A4Y2KNY7_ARAVE|nr:hypothetical protein AVEN_223934-1 [Araneus ventricosus]